MLSQMPALWRHDSAFPASALEMYISDRKWRHTPVATYHPLCGSVKRLNNQTRHDHSRGIDLFVLSALLWCFAHTSCNRWPNVGLYPSYQHIFPFCQNWLRTWLHVLMILVSNPSWISGRKCCQNCVLTNHPLCGAATRPTKQSRHDHSRGYICSGCPLISCVLFILPLTVDTLLICFRVTKMFAFLANIV